MESNVNFVIYRAQSRVNREYCTELSEYAEVKTERDEEDRKIE